MIKTLRVFMIKRKKILLSLGFLILGSSYSQAQQTAMFGQFQYNMLELNPAYAGYRETFNISGIHRSQWVGFDGAPVTQTLSFNKPLKTDEFAFGGAIAHDKIGPTNSFNISIDGAYRLKLGHGRERTKLSFGLKGSINRYQTNLTSVGIVDKGDESFLRNENGAWLPNIGAGAFLYGRTYFVGVSAPKLLTNKLVNKSSSLFEYMEGREARTYYMTAGKVWKIRRQFSFYPAILVKATKNAPLSGGAFLNFIVMNEFKIGAYYNFKEVAGALAQWQVSKKLRLGYTLEMPVTSLFGTNLGSHEIMLNYSIKKGRTAIIYPKHF